jgi:predicted transcriptional regulator
MNDTNTPRSLNEQTKVANLAEAKQSIQSIEAQLLELKSCIRSIEAVQAEPQYTKEKLAKMLREAYNLGATAQEESMTVRTNNWSSAIEVEVEVEEGGFRYYGDVEIDTDTIKEAVTFDDHNMTDEQVEEILNA